MQITRDTHPGEVIANVVRGKNKRDPAKKLRLKWALATYYKKKSGEIDEDEVQLVSSTNNVGDRHIAGITGVDPSEPPVRRSKAKKKGRRKKGAAAVEVNPKLGELAETAISPS